MSSSLIVALRVRANTLCRIVCFPWAGAGAGAYYPWLRLVPPSLDLLAVRLPGRESMIRQPPFWSLTDAASAIADALSRSRIRPTVFFGHSLGALLAFETARQLEADPECAPDLLVVSGAADPTGHRSGQRLHDLQDGQLWRVAVSMNPDPALADVSEPMRHLFIRLLRADFAMAETYVSDSELPLSMPICVYAGKSDPALDRTTVERWRLRSRAGVTIRWFEGGHFYLHEHATEVVERLVADTRAAVDARRVGQF